MLPGYKPALGYMESKPTKFETWPLGAFIFYAEEGTEAEKFAPKVPYKEKISISRKREVLKLQKEIRNN